MASIDKRQFEYNPHVREEFDRQQFQPQQAQIEQGESSESANAHVITPDVTWWDKSDKYDTNIP